MPESGLIPLLIALPFLGSLVAVLLPTRARTPAAIIAGAVSLTLLVIVLWLYPVMSEVGVLRREVP